MADIQYENEWVNRIKPILLGAEVAHIQYQESVFGNNLSRYFTGKVGKHFKKNFIWCCNSSEYWDNRPLEIILSNGSVLFAMMDDEGSDGGAYGLGWTDEAKPKTIKAIEKLGGTIPAIG